MKNLGALLLPFAIILASGMAIGSIHNAQMRDVIPGAFTPFGGILLALTLVQLIIGLLLWRHYENLPPLAWRGAVIAAGIVTVIGLLNLITTLQGEGSLAGWLFHEYLGLIVGPLQLIKLLFERGRSA